jgi:uncharacterized membrane protein YfcA
MAVIPHSEFSEVAILMDADLVVAIAILASAYVQGLSGVGFSLIAAPAIAQFIPGAGAIGLVNVLALSQNSFMLLKEEGRIHWNVVQRLLPGFLVGVVLGLLLSHLMANHWRPLVVAASSLASLLALVLWKPKGKRGAATLSATWSGTVNSYAGVGGPPLVAYLVNIDLEQGDYIRTLQFCFALLNIASIPFLGLPSLSIPSLLAAVAVVVIGTVLGRWTRRFFTPPRAHQLTIVVIALVALVALIRSLTSLLG